jgi:hypothetical protein
MLSLRIRRDMVGATLGNPYGAWVCAPERGLHRLGFDCAQKQQNARVITFLERDN